MYTECKPEYETTDIEVTSTIYEPEFTKNQIARELNCSVKTVERYIVFGSNFIPELTKYIDDSGFLNGKRVLSSDLVFLEEIKNLKGRFSPPRVNEILTRKYSQAEN